MVGDWLIMSDIAGNKKGPEGPYELAKSLLRREIAIDVFMDPLASNTS